MNGNTLIIDAFWVDNKYFPTQQVPNLSTGRIFHDYYYGPARHLGWMDLVLLNKIIKNHNINHIIVQNLDTLGLIAEHTHEVKVCIAYDYHRFIVRTFSKEKELSHCKPVYETAVIGGWDFSEDDKIPLRAQHYMQYLLTHTQVNSITCMTDTIKFTVHYDDFGHIKFDTETNL